MSFEHKHDPSQQPAPEKHLWAAGVILPRLPGFKVWPPDSEEGRLIQVAAEHPEATGVDNLVLVRPTPGSDTLTYTFRFGAYSDDPIQSTASGLLELWDCLEESGVQDPVNDAPLLAMRIADGDFLNSDPMQVWPFMTDVTEAAQGVEEMHRFFESSVEVDDFISH